MTSNVESNGGLPLANLSESGKPPATRLGDYTSVQEIVQQLIAADDPRNKVRGTLQGLVDGNPPYSQAQLVELAQTYRCNVNFREAEGFLALAQSAFYDLFSENPTYATCRTKRGDTAEERTRWSGKITDAFDRLQKKDQCFDDLIQLSQNQMVMFGTGPTIWEDEENWRCEAIKSGMLLVQDGESSNINKWELLIVRSPHSVSKLYGYIRDPEVAEAEGWDVPGVRKAILNVMPETLREGQDWEFHQQRIRNNDIYYSAKCKAVPLVHVYAREFSGKITHCIVEEKGSEGIQTFLFKKLNRFASWKNVICPWYFDKGNGEHHSVKGLGVKMFAIIAIKNKLKCDLVDAGRERAKVMVQPTTSSQSQQFAVTGFGPYVVLPANHQIVQHNAGANLDATLAVERELENVLQTNLSQYRQRIDKPQGNPQTAYEVSVKVAQQSTIGKTTISRYCAQADDFFTERFRRAALPNTRDPEALAFQKEVEDAGVPLIALQEMESVIVTRQFGQGSMIVRQQILQEVLGIIGLLPEAGRTAVVKAWIAARVGHSKVEEFFPEMAVSTEQMDQAALANIENTVIRTGGVARRTPTNDDFIHLQVHFAEADNQAESVAKSQGQTAQLVLQFLSGVGPHILEHVGGLRTDPSRKQALEEMDAHWKKLAKLADDLKKHLEEQAQQQQEAAQAKGKAGAIADGSDPETMIEAAKAKADAAVKEFKAQHAAKMKELKTNHDMEIKNVVTRQDLAIKDAVAGSEIRRRDAAAEPAEK